METGEQRLFAAGLPSHRLNDAPTTPPEDEALDLDFIVRQYGAAIEKKLEAALTVSDSGLVRIAGRWFPRALLIDVNCPAEKYSITNSKTYCIEKTFDGREQRYCLAPNI